MTLTRKCLTFTPDLPQEHRVGRGSFRQSPALIGIIPCPELAWCRMIFYHEEGVRPYLGTFSPLTAAGFDLCIENVRDNYAFSIQCHLHVMGRRIRSDDGFAVIVVP